MIHAVIFDMDGVIVDSEKLGIEASKIVFERHGARVKDTDVLPYIGAGTKAYVAGLAARHKVNEKVDTLIKERFADYELLIKNKGLPARKGAICLLKAVRKKGVKTALATSSSFQKIKMNLKAANIPIKLFDAIISGTRVKRFKPAPDIYLAAAKKLRIDPRHCIVVEDAEKGIIGAKRAGMKSIGVLGTFPRKRLARAGADAIASDGQLRRIGLKMIKVEMNKI